MENGTTHLSKQKVYERLNKTIHSVVLYLNTKNAGGNMFEHLFMNCHGELNMFMAAITSFPLIGMWFSAEFWSTNTCESGGGCDES